MEIKKVKLTIKKMNNNRNNIKIEMEMHKNNKMYTKMIAGNLLILNRLILYTNPISLPILIILDHHCLITLMNKLELRRKKYGN